MNGSESTGPELQKLYLKILKVGLRLASCIQPSELQVTLFWAGLVGFFGGISSLLFREATHWVYRLLTHQNQAGLIETFDLLPPWQRFLTPVLGGAVAGTVLWFGMRFNRSKSSTDYMEAIVLGDGTVSLRSSLVKCTSALFTIASGGSIGREGPLVQLSAVIASLIGRWRRWPTTRCRLIVACGAAAGIASAYNAPIAGALFVAEIVLGTLSMESFGPLVFSSVVATLTTRQILGAEPLYRIPPYHLNSNWELLPCLALGILAGLVAPWFLRLLRLSEDLFDKLEIPLALKLALGGAIVGAIAVFFPVICGNGYSGVNELLGGHYLGDGNMLWLSVLMIFIFKMIATSASFGSGAVGGVFTPTLFVGASFGYFFGTLLHLLWPESTISPSALALIGMGAFLAATTHAPIMAILMLFEMTLDYQIILPLMLVCVVAYYISSGIEKRSIYSDSLQRKGVHDFDARLARLRVRDLMKENPLKVPTTARFREIAESFITHRFNYLYVVDPRGRFVGAVSLHDIKSHLQRSEILDIVIADDVVNRNFPVLTPDLPLGQALEAFTRHIGERLPVISNSIERKLIGQISKTDLILALAQRAPEVAGATT